MPRLKNKVTAETILMASQMNRSFILSTDASGIGLGVALTGGQFVLRETGCILFLGS